MSIDQIVLDGLDTLGPADARALRAGLERQLGRRLGALQIAWPPDSQAWARLPGSLPVPVSPAAGPLGAQIADSVAITLRPLLAPAPAADAASALEPRNGDPAEENRR